SGPPAYRRRQTETTGRCTWAVSATSSRLTCSPASTCCSTAWVAGAWSTVVVDMAVTLPQTTDIRCARAITPLIAAVLPLRRWPVTDSFAAGLIDRPGPGRQRRER